MWPPNSASSSRSLSMLRSKIGDVGAHSDGDAGGVVARGAAADHHDIGRGDTGHAAHQHAAAALRAHQVVRADLGRQPARDLAHRGQQRQRAVGGLDGLIGDRRGARGQQRVGAGLGGRQMQVGEQRLALAHAAVLGLDRLLDLQQQVGLGPHLFGGVDHLGAGRLEIAIGDGRAVTGAGLDDHLVAATDQLGHAGRGDGDAELVVLDLGRDSDAHDRSSGRSMFCIEV